MHFSQITIWLFWIKFDKLLLAYSPCVPLSIVLSLFPHWMRSYFAERYHSSLECRDTQQCNNKRDMVWHSWHGLVECRERERVSSIQIHSSHARYLCRLIFFYYIFHFKNLMCLWWSEGDLFSCVFRILIISHFTTYTRKSFQFKWSLYGYLFISFSITSMHHYLFFGSISRRFCCFYNNLLSLFGPPPLLLFIHMLLRNFAVVFSSLYVLKSKH